jgi:hypothetical protein
VTLELDDNLAQSTGFNDSMRRINLGNRKALPVEKRPQPACFGECCCPREYLAMMFSAFARDQRQEGKHARVGCTAKGEWS